MEREGKESKLGRSRLSVLSAFTLFTVYSYKVVLVHSAVVTLYSPANPSTSGGEPKISSDSSCQLQLKNCKASWLDLSAL